MRLKSAVYSAAIAVSTVLSGLAKAAGVSGTALKLAQDARSEPLGIGFVALADNAGAMNINPAGLGLLKRPELSTFYSAYLFDSRLSALSFAHPETALGSLGISYLGVEVRGIDGRNELGQPTGSFTTQERIVSLALARRVNLSRLWATESTDEAASVGINLKFFESRLADAKAKTVATDVGAIQSLASVPLSIGLALRNAGPGLRYGSQTERLPTRLDLGAGLKIAALESTVVAGISQGIAEKNVDVSMGLETALARGALTVRGGYLLADLGQGKHGQDPMSGVITGFGLRFSSHCQLDAAISPGALGTVFKFGLTIRFGKVLAPPRAVRGGNSRLGNTRITYNEALPTDKEAENDGLPILW